VAEYGVGIDETRPTFRAGIRVVSMLVRPHWVPFAVSVAGAAVFAGGTVLSAAVLGWVADEVIVAGFQSDGALGTARSVWAGALAIAAITVLRALGVVTRRYYAGMTSERAERSVRTGLGHQYLRQPRSWLRSMPSGRLIAHVDADARALVESLHPLPFSLGVIFLAIMSGSRLIAIDPLIALIALCVFPAMMVINTIYSRVVSKPLADMQEQVAQVAGVAHESFEGALIVKTLGRRTAEVDRFDAAASELQGRRVKVGYIRTFMDAALSALPLIATLVVVIVGGYRVRAGAMTAGNVVEVAALFAALAIPMLVFGFLLESLIPSVVVWNRLRPIIEAPAQDMTRSIERLSPGALAVRVDDLRYAFPDQPDELVLRGTTLEVEAGEMVAIVGPTGSGKSTLCAAIAGVLDEVSDAVHVGGAALANLDPASRTDRIAYVFQEPFLFAGSIRNNVDIRNEHTDAAIEDVCAAAALDTWIATLPDGIDTIVGERGVTVSGGQRQRIALARALIGDAGLVILDDATSALDTVIEEQVLDGLRGDDASTLLVVAHRPSTIERSDRVVHLVDGEIVASGSHEELLDNPAYRDLVMAYAEAASDV